MKDTEQIKEKLDIVDIISEYVQLKPAGVNHKGLCPFHQEKSPSFMANRERQSWHCFGCGKGGDVFTFVQDIEGMEFIEALKYLAQKAGITLTNTFQDHTKQDEKQRLKTVNAAAAQFFHNVLIQLPGAKSAREYAARRGLTEPIILSWQIGFAPDQWDLLTKYLLKKGHAIDDLVLSGLTIKRDQADKASGRGYYDRFRGRIMFPIWDVHGNVVGFTGRVLVETDTSGGKYVNTPQTPLYDKSRVVFGLNKAKQAIRSNNLIVMVEGQMDVIAAHQAGMEHVIATSGTALTEEQVRLLKRYSENLSMAFDADAAGEKAAKRGIDLAIQEGMHVKVIQIPEGAGKDPDECIKKNPAIWQEAVLDATGIMEWYFNRTFLKKNISDARQKQEIVDILLPEIARIPFAVERDHWLQELAGRLSVDAVVLREDMRRIAKEKPAHDASHRPAAASASSNAVSDENKLSGVPAEESGLRPISLAYAPGNTDKDPASYRFFFLAERLAILLFRFPSLIEGATERLLSLPVSATGYGPLYDAMQIQYTVGGTIDIEAIRREYAAAKENPIDLLLMKGELEFAGMQEQEAQKEADRLLGEMKKEWITKRRKELECDIIVAEKARDQNRVAGLIQEFQSLVL